MGHSSFGMLGKNLLFKLTHFNGSEHPGFAENKLMSVPPKPLTPIRRKSCSLFIFTCDVKTFFLSFTLFPITAKAPNTPREGAMQQPAVHMDRGMLIASPLGLRTFSGISWVAPPPSQWRLTSEMPVIRYRSPPFRLHSLVAYCLILFSYWAHWPRLNSSLY